MSEPREAGPELDALIATTFFGYVWRRSRSSGCRCIYAADRIPEHMTMPADMTEPLVADWPQRAWTPHYSSDISAAFQVVAKMRELPARWRVELTDRDFVAFSYGYSTAEDPSGDQYIKDGWTCEFRATRFAAIGRADVQHGAQTLPHAVCLAALAVVRRENASRPA